MIDPIARVYEGCFTWQGPWDRGGSSAASTSKMERFVIIVSGFQPLTITTKRSILDVAGVLGPPRRVLEAYINKIIRPTLNEELDIDFLILLRNGIT